VTRILGPIMNPRNGPTSETIVTIYGIIILYYKQRHIQLDCSDKHKIMECSYYVYIVYTTRHHTRNAFTIY